LIFSSHASLQNAARFSTPILQENAFLNNRIVILVSNRSKCVFL